MCTTEGTDEIQRGCTVLADLFSKRGLLWCSKWQYDSAAVISITRLQGKNCRQGKMHPFSSLSSSYGKTLRDGEFHCLFASSIEQIRDLHDSFLRAFFNIALPDRLMKAFTDIPGLLSLLVVVEKRRMTMIQ